MIREDWALACEASRICLAVAQAVEEGDEEAFNLLWSERPEVEWKTIAEEGIALFWELLARCGMAYEDDGKGPRFEFVSDYVARHLRILIGLDVREEHPWNLQKTLLENRKNWGLPETSAT